MYRIWKSDFIILGGREMINATRASWQLLRNAMSVNYSSVNLEKIMLQ